MHVKGAVMQPTTKDRVREAKRLLAHLIECKFDLYTQGTTFVCDYDKTAAIAGDYDAMIEIQIQIIGGWLGQ